MFIDTMCWAFFDDAHFIIIAIIMHSYMLVHAAVSFAMPKCPLPLARGYTRAREYLFDSDDDMPMPELQ